MIKKIRFNPNLYEEGKVCLSIIGTWSGPKWSSVQTLKSLLLSIQSLLDEYPIINEPSYENVKNEIKEEQYKNALSGIAGIFGGDPKYGK